MQSKASTVEQYLAELPADRREAIETVRRVILDNLGDGYEEGMQYGMIGYYVPHRLYPPGYHCDPKQPLGFAALASQKNYMSLYAMSMYGDDLSAKAFQDAWAKTGKKLDMGKCCIRFKRVEDLALDLIADSIKRMPLKKWIAFYESVLKDSRKKSGEANSKASAKNKPAATRAVAKKANPKIAKRKQAVKKTAKKKSSKKVKAK